MERTASQMRRIGRRRLGSENIKELQQRLGSLAALSCTLRNASLIKDN